MPYYFYSEDHFGRKRKIQEDSQYSGAVEDIASPISHLLLVADGMGGHSAGEIASGLAKSILIDLFIKGHYKAFAKKFDITPNEDTIQYLKELCRQVIYYINNKIKEKAKAKSMGTTCTFALVLKSASSSIDVIIGHVGDSRAYILRQGKLKQITEDDSIVWQSYKAGRITKDQIRTQKGNNILTKALGADTFKYPQIIHIKLLLDDILLICSDGLHGLIGDSKIQYICNSSKSLQEIAKRLIHEANFEGGKDNISISLFSGNKKSVQKTKKKINKWFYLLATIFLGILTLSYLIVYLTMNLDEKIEPEVKTIEVDTAETNKLSSTEFGSIQLSIKEPWYLNKLYELQVTVQKDESDSFEDFRIQYKVDGNNKNKGKLKFDIDDDKVKINIDGNTAKLLIKKFRFNSVGQHTIAVEVFKSGNSKVKTDSIKVNVKKAKLKKTNKLKSSIARLEFVDIFVNESSKKKIFELINQNKNGIEISKIIYPENFDVLQKIPFKIKKESKKEIYVIYRPQKCEILDKKISVIYNNGKDTIDIIIEGRSIKNEIEFRKKVSWITINKNEKSEIDTIRNYEPGKLTEKKDEKIITIKYTDSSDVPDSIQIIYKDGDSIWSTKKTWKKIN